MDNLSAATKICMVIGDPVEKSLSPVMHNSGYRALGLQGRFVYVAARVTSEALPSALQGIRSMNIRGVSCTMPHKNALIELLDHVDEVAGKIGAVNTIVNDNGVLSGTNTDWTGVLSPLQQLGPTAGKKAAILGSGGAARAACYALRQGGAGVSVFCRSPDTAKSLRSEFDAEILDISEHEKIGECEIIINSTPLGMGLSGQLPVPEKFLSERNIVFDMVYSPLETPLIKAAAARGARIIYGTEMLLYQGAAQFELYTGMKAPLDAMRAALLSAAGKGEQAP